MTSNWHLCQNAYLHDIPLADKEVDEQRIVDENGFTQFFAASKLDRNSDKIPNTHYRVTRSRYGNHEATTTTRPVRPANNLNVQIDLEKKAQLTNELTKLRAKVAEVDQHLQELLNQEKEIRQKDDPIRTQRDELMNKKKKMQNQLKEYDEIKVRLDTKENQLEELLKEAREHDIEKETAAINKKYSAKAIKRATMAIEALNLRIKAGEVQKQRVFASLKAMHFTQIVVELKHLMEANNHVFENAKRELDEATKLADEKKELARRKLNEAKKTGEPTPQQKDEFQKLPNDLDELNALLAEQEARVNLTAGQNDNVLKEYEERKKKIEEMEEALLQKSKGHEHAQNNLNKLEREWKPHVEKLVAKVSDSFGAFMKKLDCSGECKLTTDVDYDKWGIEILVKFRNAEKMQVLTRQRQSGGERAVSTILYLMSLQDIARSPFRVVDEINQGMDPRNERLVHKIIVDTATQPDTSQYFLITPKLLPDLEYNDKMKILCIFNGDWQPELSDWSLDKFINRLQQPQLE